MRVGRIPGVWSLVVGLLATSGLVGCAHGRNTVTGRITPEHFQFKTIVELNDPDQPDGWRAVCIHARMTAGDSGATDLCKFEVGLPLRSHRQGNIPQEKARRRSAALANDAAEGVLANAPPGEMIGVLCIQFKRSYERLLKNEFAGARVSACGTKGVETVRFDIPAEAPR